jgi:chloramphenicol 3-O-phosphotransferase
VSAATLDATEFQQRVQVIFDQIQNSILSVPFDLHGPGYADISSSLFEVNRTACILLLDGVRTGLSSSSPALAEGVKEVQTQVNVISFLPNVPPKQYIFATCIAKSFAADTDMSFMNTLIASIHDQSIETTAHLLLAMAHCRNAVW